MIRTSHVVASHKTYRQFPLARKLAPPFSRRKLAPAIRTLGPSLVALTFVGVARAQGTMDFSGAQTLMGTFNWRNDYVAVEQFSRSIVRGHYIALLDLHRQHQQFALQWDSNLQMQGFLEAFSDKSIRG